MLVTNHLKPYEFAIARKTQNMTNKSVIVIYHAVHLKAIWLPQGDIADEKKNRLGFGLWKGFWLGLLIFVVQFIVYVANLLVGLVGKVSAWRVTDPGLILASSDFKNWYYSGYPAKRLLI